MPSYFFHLAFELLQQASENSELYRPQSNENIFQTSLPSHQPSSWASLLAPRSPRLRSHPSQARPPLSRNRSQGLPSRGSSAYSVQSANIHETGDEEEDGDTDRKRKDWRWDRVTLESIDMVAEAKREDAVAVEQRVAASGIALKGRYVPSTAKTTEIGWGVVHLYRDAEPSSHIGKDTLEEDSTTSSGGTLDEEQAYVDKDCTTLCILAVPSYMTPADLLGWIGEETTDHVSHLRLVRSSRANKYMVLMKFREAAQARRWHKIWNGKPFNSLEPENCHVVFVKSIQFKVTGDEDKDPSSFPDRTNDPFISSRQQDQLSTKHGRSPGDTRPSTALTAKPVPPPTPSLIELPTCPVCLERMDESTGLATIFCQHVFHCACLQKWKNSGCPVCRYTQNEPSSRSKKSKDGEDITECVQCGSRENLWVCLICGNVGCGRYDEAHAFSHYEQSGHTFAMNIATQHIWDYAGDDYVHRLIRNKADGQILDMPSAARDNITAQQGDFVPLDKLHNVAEEYTYLITSQLESQRQYFQMQLDRAVDKAAQATTQADDATAKAEKALDELSKISLSSERLEKETVPGLERESERAQRRAEKFEGLARKMEKEWKEKEVINNSLMERISHLEKQVNEWKGKAVDLEEMNRDLSFFISSTEKLKDAGEEVQQGSVTIGDAPDTSTKGGRKKKHK